MKVVTSTDEYTIYQRRDGRHAVKDANKAPINGDEKIRILLENDLIKAPAPKAPEPEADAADDAVEVGVDVVQPNRGRSGRFCTSPVRRVERCVFRHPPARVDHS